MKKFWAAFFAFLTIVSFSTFADDLTISDAEPYDTKAVPQWLKDVRRGEIITLGSWPFTTLLVSISYSFGMFAAHNWDSSYFRNPFSSSGEGYSYDEIKGVLLTSAAISVGIGVTDLIVNIVKREKAKKRRNAEQLKNITVTPVDSGQDRMFIFEGSKKEYLFGDLESAVF